MIYYFTPYHPDGLGKAYNTHCALVPNDDDWICLQDIDVMFFSSQQLGQQIQEAINANPKIQVFTCMTNRLCARCQQQIQDVKGLREQRDLVLLKKEADRRAALFRGKIEPVRGFFAGFFMVFQKKLWRQFPFPEVGSQGGKFLGIDSSWAKMLRDARIQVGMMHGLMAAHFYRLDTGETVITHLNDEGHNVKIPHFWQKQIIGSSPPGYLGPIRGGATTITLNPSIRPPGGYRFRDSDGLVHTGTSPERLVAVIRAYRKRVGKIPGDPEKEMIAQIYARFPRCCIVTY